jgi:hypothetical protein
MAPAPSVLLTDIVDAIEMFPEEASLYLDLDTGQVEQVSHSLLRAAEDGEDPPERLPEWQREEWEVARRIASTDRFRRLPTKFDVHEWAIMQNFANLQKPDNVRTELLGAIHGAGAFRHFKSTIRRHRIEDAWFAFRTEALTEIAKDWCEAEAVACK